MASLSAHAARPAVKIIGKQLARANTPEKQRDVFKVVAKLLAPSTGTCREAIQLDGIRSIRMSTEEADKNGRAVLMFHGGGYVFGTIEAYAGLGGRYAKAGRAPVYLPDYRLAPEYPFPGAVEDGLKAYKALLERYPADKLAVTGDSAGGGLSVATLQAARDEGLPMPSSLVLLSPWLDVSGESESMTSNKDTEILILPETIARCSNWYASGQDKQNDSMSPLYGSFAGFPPTLVQVSENEMLYSDSVRFTEKAKEEGVDVTLHSKPDLWHVWQLMAPTVTEAREAITQTGNFFDSHFAD